MSKSNLYSTVKELKKEVAATCVIAIIYFLLTSILFREQMILLTDLHIGDVYLYFLIPAIWLFFFGLLVVFQSFRTRDASLTLITLAILSFGLSYFFGFLNWDPGATSTPLTLQFSIQLLLSNIATIFFVLHFELLEYRSPDSRFLSVILFLLGPLMAINVYEIISILFMNGEALSVSGFTLKTFTIILTQLGSILVIYRVISQATAIFTRTLNQGGDKSVVGLQFIGVFTFMIHVILEIMDEFISVYNTPWLLMAIVILTWAYLRDPYSILLKPTNVMFYCVIDKRGLPYYFRSIDEFFKENVTDATLISGLVNALTSLSIEVVGAKSVESMDFGDRTLIIEYRKPLYLVCIATKANYFLVKQLSKYLVQITHELPKIDVDGAFLNITPEMTEVFHKNDKHFFPYILT